MATNKNNRKKGRKRQQMHRRPVPESVAKAQQELETEEIKKLNRQRNWNLVGLLLMIVGFVVAFTVNQVVGLPITFAGSVVSLMTVSSDSKHPRLAVAGYIVYCAMVLLLWISAIQGAA